jgi:hypothetical protein
MFERRQRHSSPAWTAAWICFLCAIFAYTAVILLARNPPPLVDYPDWVYQGVLFHGVLTARPIAGYALKHYPVPNSTTTVALGLLDSLFPWELAAKLWIVLYLALAAFTSWTLLRALQIRDWQIVVALPSILFLNLDFWYGHISFEVGLCLVLLLLTLLVRGAPAAPIAILLALIFFTHMEACACALLLLALWCAATRRWNMLWASLPTIALTLWYAAARLTNHDGDIRGLPDASYTYGSPSFFIYKINTFVKVFGYINACTGTGLSQSEQMLGRPLFLALIAASLAIAALCLVQILRASSSPSPDLNPKVIRSFILTLLLLSALLPQSWLGVADPGSRLLLVAAAAGLLLIDWRGRSALVIACLSALFCLANLLQFATIERNPRLSAHRPDLPAPLLHYGHVEPSTRLVYYDKLERGQMDQPIFPTGLFIKTSP